MKYLKTFENKSKQLYKNDDYIIIGNTNDTPQCVQICDQDHVSGSGDVYIYATEYLDALLSGSAVNNLYFCITNDIDIERIDRKYMLVSYEYIKRKATQEEIQKYEKEKSDIMKEIKFQNDIKNFNL